MIRKFYSFLLVVPLFTLLWVIGCGDIGEIGSEVGSEVDMGDSGGGSTDTGNPILIGTVQKGPFLRGAEVVVKELEAVDLLPTGVEHFVEVSNDLGEFEFINTIDIKSSYVEIEATGYYFNEIYGIRSYLPITLSAFVDISANQEVNVNLLTTIALKREKYLITQLGKTYEEAKIQARNEVLNLFNFPEDAIDELHLEDVESFIHMNIGQAGKQNAVLLSLAILLQNFQNKHSLMSVSQIVEIISSDIETDGVFDDTKYIDSIFESAAKIDLAEIRANLEAYYQALTNLFSIPDFEYIYETYIKPHTRIPAPIFSLSSATYNRDIRVELYSSTAGATIYYSINGGEPAVYLAPITVSGNQTVAHINAWAEIYYMEQSLEVSSYYVINYDYENDPRAYKTDMTIDDYRANMAGTWVGYIDRPHQWMSPDSVRITFDEAGRYSAEKLSFFIDSDLPIVDISQTPAYENRGSDIYYGTNTNSDDKSVDVNQITANGKAVADFIALGSNGRADIVGKLDNIAMSDDLNHLQYDFRSDKLYSGFITFHLFRWIE